LQKVCLKTSWRKGVSNWLGVEDWFYIMRCWALSLLWFPRALFIEQDALCTLICICSLCHYRFVAKGWFANTHCVCGVQVLREVQEQYQWKMTQLRAKLISFQSHPNIIIPTNLANVDTIELLKRWFWLQILNM